MEGIVSQAVPSPRTFAVYGGWGWGGGGGFVSVLNFFIQLGLIAVFLMIIYYFFVAIAMSTVMRTGKSLERSKRAISGLDNVMGTPFWGNLRRTHFNGNGSLYNGMYNDNGSQLTARITSAIETGKKLND